jgi:hypothetical protein
MDRKYKLLPMTLACLLLAFVLLQFGPGPFERSAASVFDNAADAQSEAVPVATTVAPGVLVELFTSEGCSTCPPADKLLADLERNQPVNGVHVIILGEHVDYWNHLGWKDPFSSAQFSQRQTDYARALGIEDVYTPQMIVDGRAQFVGSSLPKALEAIAKAATVPKASLAMAIKTVAPNSINVTIQVKNVPDVSRGDKAEVVLAVVENGLMSKVTRGENSGRALTHSAVTRKLIKVGPIEQGDVNRTVTLRLDPEWKPKNLKVVAFVQQRARRGVLGVSAIGLGGE